MALLKAFVLQVVLFGLYKLFLEQIVEQHLVPDELKRNCLVGLIGLLCFGIQLYTDNSGEDENDEADVNPKSKSRGTVTTKSESAEISGTYEKIATDTNPVAVRKFETALRETASEKKMPCKEPKAEMITEVRHSNTFAEFHPDLSDTIPSIDEDVGIGDPEVPASTAATSCRPETTTTPVSNGFSETNDDEELDEEAIEIDQFVAIKTQPIQAGDVTEQSNGTDLVEAINTEDEVKQSGTAEIEETTQTKDITEESEQVEAIKEKDVTKTSKSACLSFNGDGVPTEELDKTCTLNIKSSEAGITNNVLDESLNINNIVSGIIESDEVKIRNEQEMALSSELDKSGQDVKKFKTSSQETSKTNVTSTAVETDIEIMHNNHTEASKVVETVSSQSNKLKVASTMQKVTAAEVCVAPILIDISFIYACH